MTPENARIKYELEFATYVLRLASWRLVAGNWKLLCQFNAVAN